MGEIGVAVFQICIALCLAPLLTGFINRVKAIVAGRRGQPLLQTWYDIAKLLGKAPLYSRTTTWVFRAGPIVGAATAIAVLILLPWGGGRALVAFDGDVVLFVGLLGLGRFLTILAALDTGSSFEGMGASREAWLSALTEPAVFLALAALAHVSGSLSLSDCLVGLRATGLGAPAVILAAVGTFIVLLAENARIPIDDPTTHLELTMIHEVMVLDHSGVDFAFVQYGAGVKLWIWASLFAAMLIPRTGLWLADIGLMCAGV
ncbi:MAG TPA: NADH-quinone oxidoreductase subunit H, partial [Spirochaetia bacterium]